MVVEDEAEGSDSHPADEAVAGAEAEGEFAGDWLRAAALEAGAGRVRRSSRPPEVVEADFEADLAGGFAFLGELGGDFGGGDAEGGVKADAVFGGGTDARPAR